MDHLFKIRTLTTAVNNFQPPALVLYNRYFAGRARGEVSDRLAFDIITGSQKILSNISIYAQASVTDKTGRKTITMEAPRLATKRHIAAAELNSMRGFGSQNGLEMLQGRIAREQMDMMGEHWRTLEFYAANALKGKIYDANMKTLLCDFLVESDHRSKLAGNNRFSEAASDPIKTIRAQKLKIEDDSGAPITGWTMVVGNGVMDALLNNTRILDLLETRDSGERIVTLGAFERLVGVEIIEYNGSYIDADGNRRRYINANEYILIGESPDLTDMPYAPVIDFDAPGGVGNPGAGQLWFSKSWESKDPSGRWMKVEGRPLPVLQRPGNVIICQAID